MFNVGFSPEIREEMMTAQHFRCKVCSARVTDFHHKLPNTDTNQKLFPLYTNSIFNCVGLCRACHQSSEIYQFKVTMHEAAAFERWLEMFTVGKEKENDELGVLG